MRVPTLLRKAPRQTRARSLVDAIVEAARRRLVESGLDGFTTNAVADRAGVSIGSLYQYFPNKESILAELARREQEAFVAAIEHAASTSAAEPFESRLRTLIGVAIHHQFDRPEYARLLDEIEAVLLTTDQTVALDRRFVDVVETVLRERVSDKTSRRERAIEMLGLVRGLLDTASRSAARPPADLDTRVVRAVEALLDASREAGP